MFRAAIAYIAVAWLLVQVAETVLEPFGVGDRALRIVIIVSVIGFVPTVAFAWFFEITGKGIQREADVDHHAASQVRAGNFLNGVIIVVLGIAVTYFAADKFLLDEVRQVDAMPASVQATIERYGDRSLVVLPFTSLGPVATDTRLGESLAAELQGLLAEIREWRIISRTTATAIREESYSMARIANELQVRYVVEGNVQRDDERLTVDVALIDAASDLPVWSERFERPLADVFDVQDEVVRRIVDELRITILGDPPASQRVHPDAYVRFMQARQMLDGTTSEYDQVAELLDQALAIDPEYADAFTARSWLYWRYRYEPDPDRYQVYRGLSPEDAARRSAADIAKALELDPDNAIASAYRGWALALDEGKLEAGAPWFERALALGPQNSDVIRTSTAFANHIRRFEEAVRIGEYGLVRDPLCLRCQYNLKDAYMAAGQYADAERLLRGLVARAAGGYESLGMALLLQGHYAEALESFDQQARQFVSGEAASGIMASRGMALYSLGDEAEADAAVAELEAMAAEDPEVEWDVMRVFTWRGDLPAALRAFEKLRATYGDPSIARWIISDTVAVKLENQPKVQRLLRAQGLSRDQLANVRLEFSLPGA